ncbi:MAG: hypothetical protein RR589_18380 [Hafnia sp.]|uniref:hypothetical protein n=1 Tax=Hafnia sp. TaxID=1873498 RepID=UPI002FCAB84A
MSDMNMVGIALDTAVVEKGIKDGMADRARLPLATTQAVIAQLETQMANGIVLKERDTFKILDDIARTQNTLAKSQGLVWVGKQKGRSTAQPAKVTVEGKRYLGAQFEAPRTVLLNDKEAMNATIKKAALLTGDNGVVELYAMANKVDMALPPDITPWDIVHITFSARSSAQ